MWVASLLTSGAASFGRLLVVGFLPNALLLAAVWVLLRARSFTGPSDWALVMPTDARADAAPLLLFLAGVAVLTALMQPFQIRLIRVLEGYWAGNRALAWLAPLFVEFQRRRLMRLRWDYDRANRPRASGPTLRAQVAADRRHQLDQVRKFRAAARIGRFPDPRTAPLLPTALGNALRTGESTAGQRYGLDTLTSWPRLYPLLSDRLTEVHNSARNALDAAVNLSVSLLLISLISAVALHDELAALWLVPLAALLSFLSYLGAIAAATAYNDILRTAYDLHRFDLLRELRQKLPSTTDEEVRTFGEVSDFLMQTLPSNMGPKENLQRRRWTYEHHTKKED